MTLQPETIGLRTSDTDTLGVTRSKLGKSGWTYSDSDGKTVSQSEGKRIDALAIPPAWQDVWISPDPKGHILAYGSDEKGRRQYIYHPEFRAAREAQKFSGLADFARGLPRLRKHIAMILDASEDTEDLAIAAIIRLLDTTGLRIGHHRFRRRSGARGLTTLSEDNVSLEGDMVILKYTAKGGKDRKVSFNDEAVADVLRQLQAEPGSDVFSGEDFSIRARHVNAYIQNTLGEGFSAKDFRTWGGSVTAVEAMRKRDADTLKAVSEDAAEFLGNTPSIAKTSYIHPKILDIIRTGGDLPPPSGPTRLYANERVCFAVVSE
ncbi:DNA topoisomerase IB [Litorimonas sp. RW-G-Af-16]|uniref:DNA topoisomerase IB n=1 Tax=Litorimonas sp. RW-G-Af-16 TaxID=3241168 RepID=UPI00390C68AC